MNSEDSRNLILAIVLSVLVLIGWNYFYAAPQMQKDRATRRRRRPGAPSGAAGGAGGAA